MAILSRSGGGGYSLFKHDYVLIVCCSRAPSPRPLDHTYIPHISHNTQVFIEKILMPLLTEFPNLDVVMEHITTKNAVDFIRSFSFPGSSSSSGANSSKNSRPGKLCATITAHHLLYNRNSLFVGGICPHMYCLPILKREEHRLALVDAATSGDERFFLGTDSAPHAVGAKESQCGCAGIFTAHAAIELYAGKFRVVIIIELWGLLHSILVVFCFVWSAA